MTTFTRIVGLDFETYFAKDYSLRNKNMSTSKYVRDPRFKVNCLGLQTDKCEYPIAVSGDEVGSALHGFDWKHTALLCHHTQFDALVLSHHFGIVPAYYFDTMSMARALHHTDIGASLNEVAQFYGLGNKMADVLMQTKGADILEPELMSMLKDYCKQDVNLMWQIFRLMRKGFPEKELDLIDQTIRMFADPVLEVDRKLALSELKRERAEKKKKIRKAGVSLEALSSAEKFAAELRKHKVQPPTKISAKTGKKTYAFAQTDDDFKALADHPDEAVRALQEARTAAKSTIGETRAQGMLDRSERKMKLPIYLSYYRAHTGRWSGGDKFNPQNLPRGSKLRKCILAPKGQQLLIADSSQIEARVLAWLADEEQLLDAFKAKRDLYCEFASEVYGKKITKKNKTERFVGKSCILGLGFGTGGHKLQYTLALGINGPSVFMEIDDCFNIVSLYRRKYSKIPELWYFCQSMLPVLAGAGNPVKYKCLEFRQGEILLPNGLSLKYPDLQINETGDWTYSSKNERIKIYSSKIVENIVQALARIIVSDQLLEVARTNRIVLFSHDELVSLGKAKTELDNVLKIMRTVPKWAAGLPLDAEAHMSKRYDK